LSDNDEECYVFVKVDASENLGKYIDYTVFTTDKTNSNEESGIWTALNGVSNVYYCKVATGGMDNVSVLLDDNVKVNTTATAKGDKEADPTLSFTAYAIQSYGFADAADAWNKSGWATTSNN
jgi:hypothetical protein